MSVEIAESVEIQVPVLVDTWGQGVVRPGSAPGAGGPDFSHNGEDPWFVGGAAGDGHPTDSNKPYCNGASGWAPLVIRTNANCYVTIPQTNLTLNMDSGSASIPGSVWLADHKNPFGGSDTTKWYLASDKALMWNGAASNDTLRLMAFIRRQGLSDASGIYTDQVLVQVATSAW